MKPNAEAVPYRAKVNGVVVEGEMPAADAERITEGAAPKGGKVRCGIYEFDAASFVQEAQPGKPAKARQRAEEA